MSRSGEGRRPPLGLVGALVLLTTMAAGCVSLPDDGPVVAAPQASSGTDRPAAFIEPVPPQPGDSPSNIVAGFLAAMRATPVQTGVARQFLAGDAQATWRPDRRIITFADADPPVGTSPVTVQISGANAIDSRGAWLGPVGSGEATLRFPMVVEDGEWRISQPPDALLVTDLWFNQRFRQVSVYFFDPTARILVPEPVFVPRGDQLATALVTRLLQGQAPREGMVSRSFFPVGSQLELSVTVSEDGLAEVAVQGDSGGLSAESAPLALAQLAWTLRQDPSIRRLRLTFDGEPIVLEGGETEPGVDAGIAYDPTGLGASAELFGLRDGRVVAAVPGADIPLAGPLSAEGSGLRSIGVDLDSTRVAGVTAGGDRLLVAHLREAGGPVQTAVDGAEDLLPPAWDFAGRLWVVDGTSRGAVVRFVRGAGASRLRVPGISNRRVRAFLVSRDGSRLAAVVAVGGGADVIVVSRIRHSRRGRVVGATAARVVAGSNEAEQLRVRDLQWRSPTHMVALTEISSERDELRLFAVDGAPTSAESLGWTRLLLGDPVRDFASSPVTTSPMVVVTADGVSDPLDSGRVPEVDPRVRALAYVG